MKLVVSMFVTLDGVAQAPGGPDEDRSGGFEHGGWSVPHWDQAMVDVQIAWVDTLDALLLGRGTWEIFAAHWPQAGDDDPIAVRFNEVPKHVASHAPLGMTWEGSTRLGDDVPAAVAALKHRPGNQLQVHGSPGLVQTLLRHGLVDELRLWTFPVVLGQGKRLFERGTVPAGLKLLDTLAFDTGVVFQHYAMGAPVSYGSFMRDNPPPEELQRRLGIDAPPAPHADRGGPR
ncbi:dihydrofolate reductase family protein [Pseudoxanthomonas sp.]|uniref:dihydrofolate reductase family protein n=1 Tax=Pseudoxanthomonas sp. TaxID=1871049 RepID=UPI00262D823A|nr:dihydrofolate reductase family protein [Pseudoxanthomonas sp.]WDS34679.1 MAG: dihydrofolate reductase family protein [Pseudoxanthomonas sp.]